MNEIVNKVASSSLISLDLETFIDMDIPRMEIDLKDHLIQGMILREKDFRDFIKAEKWDKYEGAFVAIHCSTDAIIPTWAFMLLSSRLEPYASQIVFGNRDRLVEELFKLGLKHLDPKEYTGAKIVIKGCGKFHIPEACYVEITTKLAPVVSSIMYGEPCSTVPILKNRLKK